MDLITGLTIGGSLLLLGLATGAWSAAPWVPTRQRDWATINQLLDLRPGQIFYEIGCGHGHLLAYLAQKNPDSHLVGLEISPLLALAAAWKTKRQANVTIRWANLWRYRLDDADAVYVFLLPKIYPQLIKKFKNQLPPAARIVIGDWPLVGCQPQRKLRLTGSVPYYLYLASDL
jgi:SAM-dependent methyltransferase